MKTVEKTKNLWENVVFKLALRVEIYSYISTDRTKEGCVLFSLVTEHSRHLTRAYGTLPYVYNKPPTDPAVPVAYLVSADVFTKEYYSSLPPLVRAIPVEAANG
jgi:hypothetical protein